MSSGFINVPVPQQSPVTLNGERQIVKTKTIGRNPSSAQGDSFRAKFEEQRRARQQSQEKQESEEQAEKHRNEMLDKAGSRRHLKLDVIVDASIVQVTVINSEDGTVIRKIPPDKVVGMVQEIHETIKERNQARLDIKA